MQYLNPHRKLLPTSALNFELFAMKFVILILVFWNGVLIEGAPNDYKQILQPRSTEDTGKFDDDSIHGENPDTPGSNLKEEITNNDDNTNKDNGENIKKDHDEHTIKKNIEIVPVEEVGADETAEPLENYLDRLKEEAKESKKTDPHTMPLLSGLNKIMKETPTKLAKVLINNTWHLFDLGTAGSSRRTRNLQETSYLMAPFYALAAMLQQLTQGMHLTGNANVANSAQGGSIFDFLFPLSYLAHMFTGSPDVHKNVLGAIASHGAPKVHNNPSVNYILVIDNRHKQKADRMLEGKTPNETLLKVKEYLKKPKLDTEEQFYIAWKLYDLFTESYDHDDKTNLKIIKLIIEISQDPRFNGLFDNLKTKDDPEFGKIWKLFKNSQQKLNKKYRNILSNLPEGTIIQHPSPNCFVIGPIHHDTTLETKDDLDSKDEKRKLFTRGLDSSDDYRICCIDDNNETKANRFLGGESNSELLPSIEKNLSKENLDPEHGWYIILKLYNMFKKLDKNDTDKDKIIQLINQTGKDPKFKKLFENIKAKNEPRFQDIWKTFNSDPKDLEESIKSPLTLDKDTLDKLDPRIYDILKNDPLLSKKLEAAKIPKVEPEDKKDAEHLKTIEHLLRPPTPPADPKGKPLASPEPPKVGGTPPLPPRALSWFHDPGIEHSARVMKDLANQYASKNNISYSDLEGVEKLLKNPALDPESQNNLITFVHKWYGTHVRDEKMKPKFDELVRLIRQNPEYNKQFETLNPFRQEQPNDKATKDPQNASADKIYNLSGAPLESFLKHVADMLKNPLLAFHERMSLIKFLYSWQKFDNVDERIKQKVEETIHSIKEYELNYQIYETLRQAR